MAKPDRKRTMAKRKKKSLSAGFGLNPPSITSPTQCASVSGPLTAYGTIGNNTPGTVTVTAVIQTANGPVPACTAPCPSGANWAFTFNPVPSSPCTLWVQLIDGAGNTALASCNLNCQLPLNPLSGA